MPNELSRYNEERTFCQLLTLVEAAVASLANTLGGFLSGLLAERQISNRALAAQAGVSESVIRNMLKHGIDPKAKDPDAQSLRRIADALGINALYLFQLVGYIPPLPGANTARAEYLADV